MDKLRCLKYGLVLGIVAALAVGTVALAEPGGADDPVVTKGYIDQVVMPQVEEYVSARAADFAAGNGNASSSASFSVVNMSSGQKIIGAAGAEIILRMGQATVLATDKGGLADTTAGYDLSDGSAVPANHLLIVPVADGRGVRADSDAIVMIKGGYTLETE